MADASDQDIWQYAAAQGFTIVSLDSDFADMATLFGPPPKVLWLRCGNQPTAKIEELLRERFPVIGSFENDESAACLEIY
jgi:predicted nuclease of predicted toxin-antitoxin system